MTETIPTALGQIDLKFREVFFGAGGGLPEVKLILQWRQAEIDRDYPYLNQLPLRWGPWSDVPVDKLEAL